LHLRRRDLSDLLHPEDLPDLVYLLRLSRRLHLYSIQEGTEADKAGNNRDRNFFRNYKP
jgi:hypothetical protein